MSDPLQEYRHKRRFSETSEPKGRSRRPAKVRQPRRQALRFVVQEHHATRTHWDFRLEMGGTLKSWAVPKGPTLDPNDKRLAVPVEDHPLEYMEFEGVIPQGNYGAGSVMVWDLGTYDALEGDPRQGYERGKLTVLLHGRKLRGEFHLVRTKMGGQVQWLMFKKRDDDATPGWSLPSPSISVKTGRTIEQIKADATAQWGSGNKGTREPGNEGTRERGNQGTRIRIAERGSRTARPIPRLPGSPVPSRARKGLTALGLAKPGKDPYPRELRPMLATLVEEPFDRPHWQFEVKWDGFRAIVYARRRGPEQQVTIRSRGGLTMNQQFPEVVQALYDLNMPDAVLDGEIVALDDKGRAQFQLLQPRIHVRNGAELSRARRLAPVIYYVFDILYFNGYLLLNRPLRDRRRVLEAVLPPHAVIRLAEVVQGHGRAFYGAAQRVGIEGIVGKRENSLYEPGKRSDAWVKIKVKQRLEAVIGGYTQGRGARAKTFGAILLGAHDQQGHLQYIGHCGSGFSDEELRRVFALLHARADSSCPFIQVPPANEPATWVRPELVADIEYGGWTADGLLRIPVYKGLRTDKAPHEVELERPRTRERGNQGTRERPKSPITNHQSLRGRESRVTSHESPRAKIGRSRGPKPQSLGPLEEALARAKVPLEFTNLDKVFWPDRKYTKGDLIKYYLDVSNVILPHLHDRPVTLRRFPNGIGGESFYQKDYPDAPQFAQLVRIWTESGKDTLAAPVCNNLATLLWLAQLANVEIHTWFSRITPLRPASARAGLPPARSGTRRRSEGAGTASTEFASSEEALRGSALNRPDYVVFDIDPYIFPDGRLPQRKGEKDPDYTRRGFSAAVEAAVLLREVLKSLRLEGFVKTSGKTGLHVFVPIVRRYTCEQTHAFAKTVTQYLEGHHPKKVTTAWAAEKRVGKVFLDYNQNRLGATLASAYSVRPTPEATVSMPVSWKELERGFDPLEFTLLTVPAIMRKRRDPWAELLAHPQLLEKHL